MEESAKRAIFIGVCVFVAIIIISIVVVAISAANKAETVAKEYTGQGIKRDASAQSLLGRDKITGEEVIYLLQAAKEEKDYSICIYSQDNFPENLTNMNINNDKEWLKDYGKNLGKYINVESRYSVSVNYGSNPIKVSLIYEK